MLVSVVVSVDFDRLDESNFCSLNKLIACSEVIAGPESEKLPNLFLAINGCRFCEEYDDQTFEKALQFSDGDLETDRNSIRKRIKAAFPCRSFCAVPRNHDSSYASAVHTFRDRVVFEAHPLNSNDLPFDGSMFFQLLSSLVEKCNDSVKIETQDIYKTVVWKKLKETADRAIASFWNHYPVDAKYRKELDGLDFKCEYDRFLQPLSSKTNHRNSEVVQELVGQSLQTMTKHAQDVLRENKRKGDEVVESNYQTRWRLIDRSYEKQSNAWAIVGGASGGVITAGGPIGAALIAVPGVNLVVLGVGAIGAVAGGWSAAKATETYIMTSTYALEKRNKKKQVNGKRCCFGWTVVREFTDSETVNEKKDWKEGEVSHESEWRRDDN